MTQDSKLDWKYAAGWGDASLYYKGHRIDAHRDNRTENGTIWEVRLNGQLVESGAEYDSGSAYVALERVVRRIMTNLDAVQ